MRDKSGKVPREYIDYLLIKDLYHCTPEELENQDATTLDMHAEFMRVEIERQNLEDQRAKQQAKLKNR